MPAHFYLPTKKEEMGSGKGRQERGLKVIIFFYPLMNCCCFSQSGRAGTFSYIFHGPPLYFRKLHLGATDGNGKAVGSGRLRLSQKGKVKTMFQKHTSQQRDGHQGPKYIRTPNIKAAVSLLHVCESQLEEGPLLSA